MYKKKYAALFLMLGLSSTVQCVKNSWRIEYNEKDNKYIGTKERYPHEHGSFKYYTVYVSCNNGVYQGYDINDYADGNHRPFGQEGAKKYFAKFKILNDLKKPKS